MDGACMLTKVAGILLLISSIDTTYNVQREPHKETSISKSDLVQENLIIENNGFNSEHRKKRDTYFLKNDEKSHNELWKTGDLSNTRDGQTLDWEHYDISGKEKQFMDTGKQSAVFLEEDDSQYFSGSGDETSTSETTTEEQTTATTVEQTAATTVEQTTTITVEQTTATTVEQTTATTNEGSTTSSGTAATEEQTAATTVEQTAATTEEQTTTTTTVEQTAATTVEQTTATTEEQTTTTTTVEQTAATTVEQTAATTEEQTTATTEEQTTATTEEQTTATTDGLNTTSTLSATTDELNTASPSTDLTEEPTTDETSSNATDGNESTFSESTDITDVTDEVTTIVEGTTSENDNGTTAVVPTTTTAGATTTTRVTTTRPPDIPPDIPPPIVPDTGATTTEILLQLPLVAVYDGQLDTDPAYRQSVMTDIQLQLSNVYADSEDFGYQSVNVNDLRNGSIIADYTVVYNLETFLDSTVEVASFVSETAVEKIITDVNITSLNQGPVQPNETTLNIQAAAVNTSIYNQSSTILSDPCSVLNIQSLCPAGWACSINDDPAVNTSSLGIVCLSACSTYFFEQCDTDDGYCYLDYVVGSQFDYVPKCACRDNTITISYDNCMHQNTLIIICSVSGGVLLIVIVALVVVLATRSRKTSAKSDWDRPAHEFSDLPRPASEMSAYGYEGVGRTTTTTFRGEDDRYPGLQKDHKKEERAEGNVYSEPVRKRSSSPPEYDNVRASSSSGLGRTNKGYYGSDSDSDQVSPRTSRNVPVTDLDADYENLDQNLYRDNLRRIDPKAKYTISRPSFISRSRSPSESSKE